MADANEFRHLLRKHRMERGLSQDALGAEVHITGSQIGHYESGRSIPVDTMADALDGALGAGGELRSAADRSRGEAVAPWLRPWKENEARAVLIRAFQPLLIPGLLQTEEYARQVIGAGAHSEVQTEERTRERMERQAATLDRPQPVILSAIIGEAALRDGGVTLMKGQLEHLVDIGHRPNVHVRVVPFGGGLHLGHGGPFALASLPNGSRVAYIDDPLEGKVVATALELAHLDEAWESIGARALPWRQSRDLILRVIDEYEAGTSVAQVDP